MNAHRPIERIKADIRNAKARERRAAESRKYEKRQLETERRETENAETCEWMLEGVITWASRHESFAQFAEAAKTLAAEGNAVELAGIYDLSKKAAIEYVTAETEEEKAAVVARFVTYPITQVTRETETQPGIYRVKGSKLLYYSKAAAEQAQADLIEGQPEEKEETMKAEAAEREQTEGQ